MNNINLFPGGGKYAGLNNIKFDIGVNDRVLDIGGGNKPFVFSTHVIDKSDNNVQRHGKDLVIQGRQFFEGDACEVLKSFPNKYFDFIYTSHTLEHIVDLPPLLDQMSRVGKRGFNAFPASDFEFLTAKKHFGHVNLLRVIGDAIYITKRPQNTIIQRMAELFEKKLFDDKEFNALWESHDIDGYRFIWEARHFWNDRINYIYYENPEKMYPQVKYFK